MLQGDLVGEMVARKERGAGIKRIAHELGVDRKTVRRWLRVGGWQPRRQGRRRRAIDQFTEFIAPRGPEVGWHGVVLPRELVGVGFAGSYQQVQRYLKPIGPSANGRSWRRCGSRPGRANRPRSTVASCGFGLASSWRPSIWSS